MDYSDQCYGARFEDAVNETLDDSVLQWPNEIYREFAKICVDYDLSNQAVDSFINFFNKNANLNKSPLPNNSREMHKFMNSIVSPNLDFKKKHIIDFEVTSQYSRIVEFSLNNIIVIGGNRQNLS
ncbi:unnamed protein product [Rhizophagus irregularis]|nr:unnamed protein product [Rhizophagus irregularis]